MAKPKLVCVPNSLIPLMPKPGVELTKLMPKLYYALLYITQQNIHLERYEIDKDDLLSLLSIQSNTRQIEQIRHALIALREFSIQILEIPQGQTTGQSRALDSGSNIVSLEPKTMPLDYDQVVVGLIDKPGFRVRSGSISKIAWSIDPSIKARLVDYENGNYSPLVLAAIGKLSLAATSLACECFKYRWHMKGQPYASTKYMDIEYWYLIMLGKWDVSKVQFKTFNQNVLIPAIAQVNQECPFTIEFVPKILRRRVLGGYFKIINKHGESKPDSKLPKVHFLHQKMTDKQKEILASKFEQFGITQSRAVDIYSKYDDFDYVFEHLEQHSKQVAKKGKPIQSHEAIIRSRLEKDYGAIKQTLEQRKIEEEGRAAAEEKRNNIFKLFSHAPQSEKDEWFSEFLQETSSIIIETARARGRESPIVQAAFRDFIVKKLG